MYFFFLSFFFTEDFRWHNSNSTKNYEKTFYPNLRKYRNDLKCFLIRSLCCAFFEYSFKFRSSLFHMIAIRLYSAWCRILFALEINNREKKNTEISTLVLFQPHQYYSLWLEIYTFFSVIYLFVFDHWSRPIVQMWKFIVEMSKASTFRFLMELKNFAWEPAKFGI